MLSSGWPGGCCEADFDRVNVTGQSGDGGIDRLGVYRLGLVSFRSSSSASDTAAVSAPVGVEVITHRDTVTAKLQPYPPAPRTPQIDTAATMTK